MPLDPLTDREVVDHIERESLAGRGGWVITPNLEHLRRYRLTPGLRPMYESADLVVPDGMPLVWASRLQGDPLPERVAGSSLVWSLAQAAERSRLSLFLLGGNPGTAEQARESLLERYPCLLVAGTQCPAHGFERDATQLARVVEELETAKPDIVYVALSYPKQEQLIECIRARFPGTWFLGVGISLSFIAGDVPRAPRWMREAGMEWLHRVWHEPKRLYRRYLVDGLPFAAVLFSHAMRTRVARR